MRSRIAVTLAAVLLGLGSLLSTAWVAQMQVRHAQAMNAKELGWKDSLVFLVFGLERRFILFQRDLAEALARLRRGQEPAEDLALEFDLLVSRINLLKEASTIGPLREEPQYAQLMAGLDRLVADGDAFLQSPGTAAGEALLRHMGGLQPQVQQFTALASSFSAHLVESQFALAKKQAVLISWLCGAQLLIALVLAGVLCFGNKRTIVAQRKLQALTDELRSAKVAAEDASHSKSRFLANMSHELRTPFQGVLGMLQLLDRSGLSAQQRQLLVGAQQSAQHLLMLLNDILDFSSVEAGRIILKPSPTDLHRLCAEVYGQMQGQARDRALPLELQMDPRLPCWVVVDATRLKQILFNLVGNAIKFTERGRVVLQVLSDRQDDADVLLRFRVLDTGIGMDAATMARLFHRFETGNDSLTRPAGGTGLGLEISRSLARLMGGDITVQSELGKGSCFELVLGVQEAQAVPVQDDRAEPSLDAAPSRALRILVADDHPINRTYLDMALRSLGHEPTVCSDGKAAVEAARSGRFDAAIMDLHMPVMDGLTALRTVRQLPGRRAALPVFILTADVMEETQAQAQAAGATRVLCKPLQLAQLAAALAQVDVHAASAADEPGEAVPARLGELQARLPAGELQRLLHEFFRAESGSVMCLGRALREGDVHACREAAHALSGVAGLLGFDGITAAAQAVRQALDLGMLAEQTPALERQLAAAVQAAHETIGRAVKVTAGSDA